MAYPYQPIKDGGPQPTQFSRSKQAGRAAASEFPIVSGFLSGYRNREDVTTLPPGILVAGSQNVVTNTFKRVGVVKGFVLDGQRDTSGNPILSGYDWTRHTGTAQHLRAGFDVLNSAGKLQFRYVASAGDKWSGNTFTEGQVYWIDLMTGLGNGTDDTGVRFNFTEFWDFSNELKSLLLMVNQTSNIFMWSGGVTTAASYTAATITKNGTDTWAQIGFLSTATYTREVLINGNTYAYTGGEGTTTLTGVTPDPSAEPVNSVVVQKVVTKANSSITGIPATFKNKVINTSGNQVYLSGAKNQSVYVSKVNSFLDFSFASPRLIGEGAILTLDGVPSAIQVEQDRVYISDEQDKWYQTQFQLSSTNTAQTLSVTPLKTAARQGAQSQAATTKIKNNIFYVSNEPIFNILGTAQNYLDSPQVQDLSFPIVNDVDSYDLDDCSVSYYRKYVYVCIPKEGLMRIYNMTDDGYVSTANNATVRNHYWEAPIGYSMKQTAVIDGDLYGHSYQSSNTFKLFEGYEFDTHAYESVAAFSYEWSNERNLRKISDSTFTEGYITTNTTLTLTLQRELSGGSIAEFEIDGSDTSIVEQSPDVASLGKDSLGKHPLGGESTITGGGVNISKFRVYKTYPPAPYFEEQKRYSTTGKNQVWELVSFASNARVASEEPTDITQ